MTTGLSKGLAILFANTTSILSGLKQVTLDVHYSNASLLLVIDFQSTVSALWVAPDAKIADVSNGPLGPPIFLTVGNG